MSFSNASAEFEASTYLNNEGFLLFIITITLDKGFFPSFYYFKGDLQAI